MFKKINILLVLLLLLVSIGAVSAADDLNDTIASDNEAIDEVTSTDDVVLTSNSHTITYDNLNSYFNSKGDLISSDVNDGDTIVIGDNFNNKKFVFEKSLNVQGLDDIQLKNCMFTFLLFFMY